jgi:VIT1/CCC1 family predicted Fe2+/Mn2+ transporter
MVLGANDGIISIACLILGVAAADASRSAILTAGMAGLVAGAASMGLGEYVSVSSQKDVERANIAKETWELEHMPEHELDELTGIFMAKGIDAELARTVAVQLTEKDALRVHLAEELGITEISRAQPLQAAAGSATAFTIGGSVPMITAAAAAESARMWVTVAIVGVLLVTLGWSAARFGGAPAGPSVKRIFVGGAVAMALTILVGRLFGTAIA